MNRIIINDDNYRQRLVKANRKILFFAAIGVLFSMFVWGLKLIFHVQISNDEAWLTSCSCLGFAGGMLFFYFRNRRSLHNPKILHKGRISDNDERSRIISQQAIVIAAAGLLIILAAMLIFGAFFNVLYMRVAEVLILLFSAIYFSARVYLRKKI